MSRDLYQGTLTLIPLLLRRDRIRIPLWILLLVAFNLFVALAYPNLYTSPMERQIMAETMRNPAMTSMMGPGYGLDNYTIGAMMAHQMLLFTAIAVAIMSILLVTRHTRGDEEGGRIEMIRSFPMGRLSSLSAIMTVFFMVNLLLALLMGLSLSMTGVASMDLQGSLLYGAILGAIGIFFMAITALFAQLAETSRGVIGYSFTFLGLSYLLRAIGDVSSEILSLLSPLGLVLRTQVYVKNYWWPVILTLFISFLIKGLALYLNSIRDLEAGFIPSKPGREVASSFMQSSLGLSWRLLRVTSISWIISMFILGASYGSVFGDIESFFESSEFIQRMLPMLEDFSLVIQFLTVIMSVIAIVSTIPPLIILFKLKKEERWNRTEHLLARSVSRSNLLGSYCILSLVVGFLVLFFSALGLWAAGSAVMDEPFGLGPVLASAMAYLPAMWVMIGLALVFIGLRPQATGASWAYLGFSFFVVYLGGILQLPEWMEYLTPFGYIPSIPIEEMKWLSSILLTLLALILLVLGFKGFRERDIYG